MDNSPEMDKKVQALHSYVADLISKGMTNYEIKQVLQQIRGLDPESVKMVVQNIDQVRTSARREAALKNMAIGAFICIVGLVITAGSYSAASSSSSGGRYVIAWGAVIFGGIQFLRGVGQLLNL
jgi:hypothetical protein